MSTTIVAAGREVPDALDRIRRYCGLPWSGGPPETWAWHYYDAVPTAHDDVVTAVDVVCAAALHPGLSRDDLAFFRERSGEVSDWLGQVPIDTELGQVTTATADHIAVLPKLFPGRGVALLSKVLHRKRPHAIPLLDRHVIDWYRPVTGKRAAAEAWPALVHAMREEQADVCVRSALASTIQEVEAHLGRRYGDGGAAQLSPIRALDIAIWMGSR